MKCQDAKGNSIQARLMDTAARLNPPQTNCMISSSRRLSIKFPERNVRRTLCTMLCRNCNETKCDTTPVPNRYPRSICTPGHNSVAILHSVNRVLTYMSLESRLGTHIGHRPRSMTLQSYESCLCLVVKSALTEPKVK